MSTNREVISRVRSKHRLLSADNQLSDRAILAELRSKAALLIKRETNLRKLWNSPNLFTTLSCVSMEPVDMSECCDYTGFKKVARSKKKLPRISEGTFGLIVQGVYNVIGSKKFIETNPNRYANVLKLGLSDNNTYYWILNDYLYVSKPDIETVRMIAYFDEEVPKDLMEEDCDCGPGKKKADCTNPLDNGFKCPSYLEDAAVTMASQELLNTYFNVPQDKTTNQLDEQAI
jgi:hypothetical protein